MVTPTRLRGTKPVKVPLHSVMDVLNTIDDLGHSEQFRAAAKESDAFVNIHPDTVNFVKDYLANNKLHEKSDLALKVVNPCPPGATADASADRYHCPHIQTG